MIRYHVTSKTQINAIGHFGAMSSVSIGETFRSIIDVEANDSDDLEAALESDDNVISYKASQK